jgi:hypothetical protein
METGAVSLYTIVDVTAKYSALQYATICRFLKERCRLILCDNCPTDIGLDAAAKLCGAEYLKLPLLDRRTANWKHASALQWVWDNVVLNDPAQFVGFIDFDTFLLKPFSFVESMQHYGACGYAQSVKDNQGRIRQYLWPGYAILNRAQCPPLDKTLCWMCGHIDGAACDVGGMLHAWLEHNINRVAVKFVSGTGQIRRGSSDVFLPPSTRATYEDLFNFALLDDAWFHYGNGANWYGYPQDLLDRKWVHAQEIIRAACAGEPIGYAAEKAR